MRNVGYTPFFFPEVGWAFIIAAVVAMTLEVRGTVYRQMKETLVDTAPHRLFLALRILLYLSVLAGGIALLIQSRHLSTLAQMVVVPTLAAGAILGFRYRQGFP